MRDGIFYAQILMRNDEGELASVSARPSDAIALAMRTQSNILVDAELLGESAIDIPHEEEGDVEAFREFLENIEPEDFE
jgi:bifunctional DNase/RNase